MKTVTTKLCIDEGDVLSSRDYRHVVGAKVYEVTNHLGNVLATVSDRRERVMSGSVVSGFGAVIKSTSDYCEIGHALSVHCRRMWVFDANRYKFGFGGQEADQEIAGDKSMYTAQFWEYDAKIGRRWNVDPMFGSYSHQSTYLAFNNNPIVFNDPLGLEGEEQNDNTLGYSRESRPDESDRYYQRGSSSEKIGGGKGGSWGDIGKVGNSIGSGWNKVGNSIGSGFSKVSQWHDGLKGNYQNPMKGPSPRVTMEELGGALNVFSVMGPLGGVVAKTTIWTALSLTSSVLSATANAKGDDVLERNMFTGDKAKIAYNLVKTGISIRGLYTGGKDLIKEGPEMINVLNIGLDGAGSYTGGGKTFNMVNEYINKQQKPIIGGKQGQNAGGINNDNVKKNEKLEASKKVKHT